MKIGLSDEAGQRAGDMIAALDRMTAALEANTAAIEASNALADCQIRDALGSRFDYDELMDMSGAPGAGGRSEGVL